jgi:hypothetical protein
MELLAVLHSKGKLLATPANIRQDKKRLLLTNTLAYYDEGIDTIVKRFTVMVSGYLKFSTLQN